MESKQNPPSRDEWERLPVFIQMLVAGKICYYASLPRLHGILYRIDLWLFPPLAFFAAYKAMLRFVPVHPISKMTVLTSAFTSAAYALFLLRPPKRMRLAHWIKQNG